MLEAQDVAVVEVEEDGDEVFTTMPKSCTKWPCCWSPDKAVLVKTSPYGFMVCPLCCGSYGRGE